MLRREHGENLSGTAIDEIERPLAVLRKTLATMLLLDHERGIACPRMRVLEAALAREHGKALLRAGDFTDARRAFGEALDGSRAGKLHARRLACA